MYINAPFTNLFQPFSTCQPFNLFVNRFNLFTF